MPSLSNYVVGGHLIRKRKLYTKNATQFGNNDFELGVETRTSLVLVCLGEWGLFEVNGCKNAFPVKFRRKNRGVRNEKKNTLLKFMDCTLPLNAVDKISGYVFERLSPGNEVDLIIREQRRKRPTKKVQVSKRFDKEPFSTICSRMYFLRSSYEVLSLASGLPGPNKVSTGICTTVHPKKSRGGPRGVNKSITQKHLQEV